MQHRLAQPLHSCHSSKQGRPVACSCTYNIRAKDSQTSERCISTSTSSSSSCCLWPVARQIRCRWRWCRSVLQVLQPTSSWRSASCRSAPLMAHVPYPQQTVCHLSSSLACLLPVHYMASTVQVIFCPLCAAGGPLQLAAQATSPRERQHCTPEGVCVRSAGACRDGSSGAS